MNQLTAIFLGPQGCGKGTQLQLVKEFLLKNDPSRNVVDVGMGKLLRELESKDTYAGRRTKEILAGGNLIPYAISTARFSDFLVDNLIKGDEHLLIDGFPRTREQVPTLDSALEFFERKNPVVVVVNISEEESLKRLLARGRSDDTEEGIRQRLKWSHEQMMPNIESFRNNPTYRVIDIFGERPIEVVHQDIVAQIGV